MADKVRIDEEECIGCETCVELCPTVFGFSDDDMKAFVIEGSDSEAEGIDDAIASCPTSCIEKDE